MTLLSRLLAALRRSREDRDLAEELDTHASLLEQEHRRRGRSVEEARRLARLDLGSPASLREAHAEARGVPLLETLLRDGVYALRSLRRDRAFSAFALLIGALGIGASTTIFGIVNALLFRPLPLRDPAALVWIAKHNPGVAGDRSSETVPVNPFVEYREQNNSFADIAAFFAFYEPGDRKLTGVAEPERVTAVPVSDNFFRVLGIAPTLGREFNAAECRANAPIVLLSEVFWKRRFASDPSIAGRALTINNRTVTVVGVMPLDFGSLLAPGTRVDFFTPLPLTPEVNRMGNTLAMIGRLSPGVSLRQAQSEADVLSGPIGARNNRSGLRLAMTPLEERVRGAMRPALLLLASAIGVVMLVLCANVAHLQLARASTRAKEVSIRAALGAGRARLTQQVLTESLILFGAASLAGLLLAVAATRLLAGLDALHLPLREGVRVDLASFGFTVLLAVLTGAVCGLAPALQIPSQIHSSLKESGRGSSAGRRQSWLRASLVVSEIALACVLLVGAGLLLRSLQRVLDIQLGFQPSQAIALRIDPPVPKGPARNAYFDDLLTRVKALPGIGAAGITDVLPLGGNRSWNPGAKEQMYSEAHPPPDAFVRVVSDGYLSAMGIALRAGRDLGARDREGAPPVMLVNETLARTLWPGQNALGKIVKYAGNTEREVVGVVADVRHISVERGGGNEFYLPVRQTDDYGVIYLVVRSSLPAAPALASLRELLRRFEPNFPSNDYRILGDVVDRSTAPRRWTALLLSGFAFFALLLAALGIFGLISYSVTQREQEIGIRMALGATGSHIRATVLRETMRLIGAGLAIGLAASWGLSLALSSLLYGVDRTDAPTLLSAVLILSLTGLLAGYLPSRRAALLDPMLTLRA